MPNLSRAELVRDADSEPRTTTLELFYDLVFVFAITQVSHLLLDNLTWRGAGQAALILLVVWWSWNYTTWVTNELDPDSVLVRLLLIVLMLASLLMAIAIPDAFGERALMFAGSYVAIQVGRHLFLTFVAADRGTIERERAAVILTWFVAAGVLWLAGALVDGHGARGTLARRARARLRCAARDLLGALAPADRPRGMGRRHRALRRAVPAVRHHRARGVDRGHRCDDVAARADPARVIAFAIAFLGTAALWWLYFDFVATLAERALERAERRTLLARDAYTYLHIVIIAGILLSAVGDEIVIAHPTDELSAAELAVVVGGPAVYLLAQAAVRLRVTGRISLRRIGGAVACFAIAPIAAFAPALFVAGALLAVLIGVIVADQVVAARRTGGRTRARTA